MTTKINCTIISVSYTHLGSGITASPVSLALNEIEIPYKFYTGSFSDWISYDENQVATI